MRVGGQNWRHGGKSRRYTLQYRELPEGRVYRIIRSASRIEVERWTIPHAAWGEGDDGDALARCEEYDKYQNPLRR